MSTTNLHTQAPASQGILNPTRAAVLCALVAAISSLVGCGDSSKPQSNASTNSATMASATPAVNTTMPAFTDIASESGLNFTHFNGATADKFFPEIMGSGGALLDYDNDGDLDILLVQSGRINNSTELEFPFEPIDNKVSLYRNDLNNGQPTFVDVTDASGLAQSAYGMGVAIGDINNDGFADVYLTNLATNALFLNNGDGTFREGDSGVSEENAGWFTSASFLDYDLDGNLDLFVTRYVDADLEISRRCTSNDGQRDYCTPDVFVPLTDLLLRGNGQGQLEEVAKWHTGPPAPSTGLGVIVADYNNDGLTDVYVANDKKANQLWLNLGDGMFEETAVMNGSAYDANGKAEASMGVTSGDVDADGDEDLFITHLRGESNTLYLNEGNAMFIDSTIVFKLSSTSLPSTGFGTGWVDPDNDSDLDLFAANGAVMIERSQLDREPYPYIQANQLFEHLDGLTFVDSSEQAGLTKQKPYISRGAAFGDIDNDGDTDILVTNNNGPVRLLRNDQRSGNNWLNVTVQGVEANRDAAGSRVGILRESKPTLWRRIGTDGSYLSANDRRVHIGLGTSDDITGIEVAWPDGTRERFDRPRLNQFITLVQGEGSIAP